jgi:hypothetical protein
MPLWVIRYRGGRIRMSGFARSGRELNCENDANGQEDTSSQEPWEWASKKQVWDGLAWPRSRTTRTEAGNFLVAPPGWSGAFLPGFHTLLSECGEKKTNTKGITNLTN